MYHDSDLLLWLNSADESSGLQGNPVENRQNPVANGFSVQDEISFQQNCASILSERK